MPRFSLSNALLLAAVPMQNVTDGGLVLREPPARDVTDLRTRLNLDNDGEDNTAQLVALAQELPLHGIHTPGDLLQAVRGGSIAGDGGGLTAPISENYADVEVFSATQKDFGRVAIPSVAIAQSDDIVLPQLPFRWKLTDFTVAGEIAASGKDWKVYFTILIGTFEIAQFTYAELIRESRIGMTVDSLTKVYNQGIGPLSTVTVRVTNDNTGAGQVFEGMFSYTYRPENARAVREAMARTVRG